MIEYSDASEWLEEVFRQEKTTVELLEILDELLKETLF